MRETKAFKTRKEKMKLILGNKTTIMVGDTGLEPVTSAMSTQRSNQLS